MMSAGRSQLWRRRNGTTFWIRAGLLIFLVIFLWVQLSFIDFGGSVSPFPDFNDSQAAILSMVPVVLHKFLAPKPKNGTNLGLNGSYNNYGFYKASLNISDIKRSITQYNLQQTVYNEDLFGPLQNDSIVIVIQVDTLLNHSLITGLTLFFL